MRTFFTGSAKQTCSVLSEHFIQTNIEPAGLTCQANYSLNERDPTNLRVTVTRVKEDAAWVTAHGHYPSGDFLTKFVLVKLGGHWKVYSLTQPEG